MEDSEEEIKTVPLAYHEVCMTRDAKSLLSLAVCWIVSLVILFGGVFAYLRWHDEHAHPADGYSIVDPSGKVIYSGLTSDEIEIVTDALDRAKRTDGES